MDLEQFRRAYMHMEGVTNTPGNFVKRGSRLVESVVNIPGAIKRDVDESKMNAKIKKDILNDIRENGGKNFDAETFSDLVKSGAARPSHTGAAMEQLGHSAAAMGKSANESPVEKEATCMMARTWKKAWGLQLTLNRL